MLRLYKRRFGGTVHWTCCLVAVTLSAQAIAERSHPAESSETAAIGSGRVIVVFDWDKILTGQRPLGSAVLVDGRRALTQCRVLSAAEHFGVRRERTLAQARLLREDRARGVCELEILPPGNFEPPPMRVRALDDMRPGDAVYAVGAQGGPRMLTKATRVTGFSGSGETRAARIPAGLPASFAGGGLFDRSGALIGVVVLHARGGEGSTLVMPVPEDTPAASASAPAKVTATTEVPPEGGSAPRAAPVAAAKPPAQPSGENRNLAYRDAMSKYLGDVVRAAVSRASYPPEARKAQWTGTSSIRFRLGPGGLLVESGVERSSGYDTLDVAALLAVRSAIAELPLPPSVEEWGMTGSVLITFQLPEK